MHIVASGLTFRYFQNDRHIEVVDKCLTEIDTAVIENASQSTLSVK